MVSVKIDDKTLEVPAGTTVLQAARLAGISIPTLCDHPSLKPYGGCRLCVVEVEGARTLQASCTLPVSPNMVVHTDTSKTQKAREFVLTLLFSERNHFCMYCQKSGGDCELQNAAYGCDMTHWPLQPNWKSYLVDASGPHFIFDHNRCILCRRCVRACADLVGNFTLNIENRGAASLVVSDYGLPHGESSCIKCGTCVQVCPTGAIIDRQGAYMGLETKAERITSTCTGCSVGCGIEMLVRDNQLIRVEGDWNAPVNGGVLCEAGRYKAVDDKRQRITTPMVRKGGELKPTTWGEAVTVIGNRLNSSQKIAALASTRLPVEALAAFKEIFADHLHASTVTSIEENFVTATDGQPASVDALKKSDCVVSIGADLVKNHQVLGFFVKRNLPLGTRLVVIDPFENDMDDLATFVLRNQPGSDTELLVGLMAAIQKLGLDKTAPAGYDLAKVNLAAVAEKAGVTQETLVAVAREIATAQRPVFVFGKGLTQASDRKAIQALEALAGVVGAALISPKGKANSMAAHALQLDQTFQTTEAQAVFLALGDEYQLQRLAEQVSKVPFLAVQASHISPLTERADVVLPVEMWAEQAGHFMNLEGRLQETRRGLTPAKDVRSNLGALEALADCLGVTLTGNWQKQMAVQTA